MADRSSVYMQIGGTIKRSNIDRLIKTCLDNYAELDYSRGDATDFLDAIEDSAEHAKAFEITGNEVSYGHFEEIETLCREIGLTYYVRSDACSGAWEEMIGFWEPGLETEITYAASDGYPVLDTRQIRKLLGYCQLEAELAKMERIEAFKFPLVIEEDTEEDARKAQEEARA